MHEIKFNRRYRSVINRQKQAMKHSETKKKDMNGEVIKINDVLISRKLNATIKAPYDIPKEDHSRFFKKVDTNTQHTDDQEALIDDLVNCFPPRSRLVNQQHSLDTDAAAALNAEKTSR